METWVTETMAQNFKNPEQNRGELNNLHLHPRSPPRHMEEFSFIRTPFQHSTPATFRFLRFAALQHIKFLRFSVQVFRIPEIDISRPCRPGKMRQTPVISISTARRSSRGRPWESEIILSLSQYSSSTSTANLFGHLLSTEHQLTTHFLMRLGQGKEIRGDGVGLQALLLHSEVASVADFDIDSTQ